jgi:hypothetical protein|tara:strand:- start:3899 stop:4417 length:519 start_codon:yes stop_codon:yes gene_type:complete
MAKTTFSGPVYSKNGFINTGPGMTVSLTADTTLTVAAHAGKILLCNDADGKFTLPTINVNANSAVAGDTDYNNLNNIGASFYFFVETAATDMDILTDGTDKFVGSIVVGVDDGSKKIFVPAAANDVITMNGGTQGGIAGSVVKITAIDDDKYLVHDSILIGSSTIATPFANA